MPILHSREALENRRPHQGKRQAHMDSLRFRLSASRPVLESVAYNPVEVLFCIWFFVAVQPVLL